LIVLPFVILSFVILSFVILPSVMEPLHECAVLYSVHNVPVRKRLFTEL